MGVGLVCRQCQMANALSLDNWVDLGSPPQPPSSTDTVDGRSARTCSSCPLRDRRFCRGTRSSFVCVCVCVCVCERERGGGGGAQNFITERTRTRKLYFTRIVVYVQSKT